MLAVVVVNSSYRPPCCKPSRRCSAQAPASATIDYRGFQVSSYGGGRGGISYGGGGGGHIQLRTSGFWLLRAELRKKYALLSKERDYFRLFS